MRPELTEAFEERLRNTPDPDAVLVGVLTGVERRRFRTRTLRIAGAVVAVLAVVATAVTVSWMRDNDEAPVANREPGIERTTTIELGWVPDDLEPPEIESTQIGDEFHYRSPSATHGLSVWVDNLGWKPPFDTGLGPHESWTEVNGRRARVTMCCGYAEVAFELPSGRWAVVARSEYAQGPYAASPETLRSQALRVAGAIREGSGVRLRVGFELDYLPRPYGTSHEVIGVRTRVGAPLGFGTVITAIGPPRLQQFREFSPGESIRGPKVIAETGGTVRVGVGQQPVSEKVPPPPRSPNTSILGRPAFESPATNSIWVRDFHGGSLTVQATYLLADPGPQLIPFVELRKTAEGVRWVG